MEQSDFETYDFDNPSVWFRLEDVLKWQLGPYVLFGPYIRSFKLKGDEQVLDFGCGGGISTLLLARQLKNGGAVTGLDTSKYWIEKASRRLRKYPNASCVAGDIRTLDLGSQKFDVIHIMHVVHDIPPEQRQDTVLALGNVLRSGGKVFIREPVKVSHGIPAAEILQLMETAGLSESQKLSGKSEYRGVFLK